MKPVAFKNVLAVTSVVLAVFAAVMNARLVGAALADAQGALGGSRDETTWVNTAYAVGEIIVIPFVVWLGSVASMRRVLVPAALAFAVTSLLAAGSHTIGELAWWRFAQGVTGGALIPLATPTFRRNLPLRPRVTAFAVYGMAATLPFALSPLLDAWLTERFGWETIFIVPAVLALVAAAIGALALPHEPFHWERARAVDAVGLTAVGFGLACLVLGADQAFRLDWFESRWVNGFFIAGAVLLIFAWWHTRHDESAALTHEVLTRTNLLIALGTYGVARLSLMVTGAVIPDFLVRVQTMRPLDFGFVFLSMAAPMVAGPLLAVRLTPRLDPRALFAGAVAMQAAALFLGSGITSEWKERELLGVLLLLGAGQGLMFMPLLLLLTQNLDDLHRPTAMTLTNLTRAGGNALGIAVMTTALNHAQRFHDAMLRERVGDARISTMAEGLGLRTGGLENARAAALTARAIAREGLVLSFSDLLLGLGLLLALVLLVHLRLKPVDLDELRSGV